MKFTLDLGSEMALCSADGSFTSSRQRNFNLELHLKIGKTQFSASDSTGEYQFDLTHKPRMIRVISYRT